MKNANTNYSLLLVTVFILSLLMAVLQLIWLSKATKLHHEEFKQDIINLMPNLALDVNQLGHDYFHGLSPNIDALPTNVLEKQISSFLAANKIDQEFYFALYQDSIGGIFKSNSDLFEKELRTSEMRSSMSNIISINVLSDSIDKDNMTDDEFFNEVNQRSNFQYFSPIDNLDKPDSEILWLALYLPNSLSKTIKELYQLFIVSCLLVVLLFCIFYFLVRHFKAYKNFSEAKDDFFNNMTHEFNTPLSSISLASKMIRKSDDMEKKGSYLNLIDKESKKLEMQIDKLLEFSLLENGQIQLDKTNINLIDLIKEIPISLKPIIEDNQATINIICKTTIIELYGDAHHLYNSFTNLVENSLKYGGKNVKIEISIEENKTGIIMSFKDNGPGIEAQFIDRIFERFYRAKKKDSYYSNGFGIGLSYVKSIVDSHNGNIKFNAEYKGGSEFIISFRK